ncbi:MAG TPA: hypothetical protein VI757_04430 [Bacteroidia bacterium]|nr:hypothetical protein [Bacteroidia bacterium]
MFDYCMSKLKIPALIFVLLLPLAKVLAQDEKEAVITLSFTQTDTTKTCMATVTSDTSTVKEKEVHFYVQRMFGLLPIGKAEETDENGMVSVDFPMDLPGDKNGNIIVIAKIEDDDTYGNVETKKEIKWGIIHAGEKDRWDERSLSASREKAPLYLLLVSNLIIVVIWGTIFYVIYQIFRIKKVSNLIKVK